MFWRCRNEFINSTLCSLLDGYTLIARFLGPTWGRQDPGGPHVGHMNFAIWVVHHMYHNISINLQCHRQYDDVLVAKLYANTIAVIVICYLYKTYIWKEESTKHLSVCCERPHFSRFDVLKTSLVADECKLRTITTLMNPYKWERLSVVNIN